jgi:hypothetical protein
MWLFLRRLWSQRYPGHDNLSFASSALRGTSSRLYIVFPVDVSAAFDVPSVPCGEIALSLTH